MIVKAMNSYPCQMEKKPSSLQRKNIVSMVTEMLSKFHQQNLGQLVEEEEVAIKLEDNLKSMFFF